MAMKQTSTEQLIACWTEKSKGIAARSLNRTILGFSGNVIDMGSLLIGIGQCQSMANQLEDRYCDDHYTITPCRRLCEMILDSSRPYTVLTKDNVSPSSSNWFI